MIAGFRRSLGRVKDRWLNPQTLKPNLRFDRPLLLFQSDDWGRVGVRDREGADELGAAGINLGEQAYDFYTLETADDLDALSQTLKKHRDSAGRIPSVVMNFILANVDFEASLRESGVVMKPLTEGLPGAWQRPHLLEAYRRGIEERLFLPALHGLTHFCQRAIARELEGGGERAQLIRTLWHAQTPYIHWRMPWIGYEYADPEDAEPKFLSLLEQRALIRRTAEIFRAMFAVDASSACSPGYRANSDTRQAWFETGVRVAQNGPGGKQAAYVDERGMLLTFRNVEMELATAKCDLSDVLSQVETCFGSGFPAVVSVHSINFHSTLRDFRSPTLALLDEFLSVVERKWPDVLYVNDLDLFQIATQGWYFAGNENVRVNVSVEGGRP